MQPLTRREAWRIYFAGIASIRLHPRNLSRREEKAAGEELAFAAHCADVMLRLEEMTWAHGSDQSSEGPSARSDLWRTLRKPTAPTPP